jgi:hypothetical protein
MAKRLDVPDRSSTQIQFRATEAEAASLRALAEYRELSISDLFRDLIKRERERLKAEGKRPPLRPRNNGGSSDASKS